MISEYTLRQIDKGIRKIIRILNKKNYITVFCCEGHLNENKWQKGWLAHIAFKEKYDFNIVPPSFTYWKKISKNDNHFFLYWKGETEEERLQCLKELYEWAKSLETIEEVEDKSKLPIYVLIAKNKNTNFFVTLYSGTEKINYEQIIKKRKKWYYDFEERVI